MPGLGHSRQACELGLQNGGLKFGHAVVEADQAMVKPVRCARPPAIHIRLSPFVVLQVAGDHPAALSRGHQFARLKAKTTEVPCGARPFVVPLAAVRVGAVLDDREIVCPGNAHNCVHVRKAHGEMNWQNGTRPRRHSLFD